MSQFNLGADGSQITRLKHRCQNPCCQKNDNMRRMLTSLTPDTSVEFKVNHGKDSIKHEKTYLDSFQDPIFDDEGNVTEVIEGVREETVRYVWNFVECRHCYRRYVLERNNDLEDEEEENLYPLFYGAK